MLNTFLGARITNVQFQQLRHGHRIRGKAPIYCRTVKERLDELNYKDELYTTKINIGLPKPQSIITSGRYLVDNIKKYTHYCFIDKNVEMCERDNREGSSTEETRKARLEHLKKIKTDRALEQLARNVKLEINLDKARDVWLETNGPLQKKQIADHYALYEHLYGEGFFVPYVNLDILYDLKNGSFLPVYSGNFVKPAEALEAPLVTYKSDNESIWTLALTSLDGHLTENDKEYVHWLVANIPGNAVEKGDTVVDYLQPFPLKGTGYHRYVFVLYKQDGRVTYDLPKVSSESLEDRTFVTRDWYQKYQDNVTPAGLAFYQCDWDHTVKDFFHKTLQTKEPIYEYDFPAPYIRPQEWFPKRKPFNLYMDKYRDPKQINKEYLLRKLQTEDPFKRPPPPLKFPNAQPLPHKMPSWLKLHERKIRLGWGRVNDV